MSMDKTKNVYEIKIAFDSAPHTREVTTLRYEAWSMAEAKKWAVEQMKQYFDNVKILNATKRTIWDDMREIQKQNA